jgi:hypothetical protein
MKNINPKHRSKLNNSSNNNIRSPPTAKNRKIIRDNSIQYFNRPSDTEHGHVTRHDPRVKM